MVNIKRNDLRTDNLPFVFCCLVYFNCDHSYNQAHLKVPILDSVTLVCNLGLLFTVNWNVLFI